MRPARRECSRSATPSRGSVVGERDAITRCSPDMKAKYAAGVRLLIDRCDRGRATALILPRLGRFQLRCRDIVDANRATGCATSAGSPRPVVEIAECSG